MTHAPPLRSRHSPVPSVLESQINKLKVALDKFNLGKKNRFSLSQGSGAVKISCGTETLPLHTIAAIRTARFCIPFSNDYDAFVKLFDDNFVVCENMESPDIQALFESHG